MMQYGRRTVICGMLSSLVFVINKGLTMPLVAQQNLVTRKLPQQDEPDEEQIRRVIRESQFNETLVIYVNPKTFDQALLTKYWVQEEKGGRAIIQVKHSVRRLLDRRWHYSVESANEEFEILSIKIFPPGDVADVRTRERWYVPMVDDQERIVKEKDPILEYPVFYRLLKIEGKWMLQLNSTPRPRN
jgi:hypothetical protein